MPNDIKSLVDQNEQGTRCKQLWCSVVLSSLDEWIGYPNNHDRLNQIATKYKLRNNDDPEWKTKAMPRMKELARKDGIKDAYDWLESRDATEVLVNAGMSTSSKARAKLLEFVIAGVPTNLALSEKVHIEAMGN